MKFRIVQYDGDKCYKIEHRILWFWWANYYISYVFDSIEEAQKDIERILVAKKVPTKKVIKTF